MIKDQNNERATYFMAKIKQEYLPEEAKNVLTQKKMFKQEEEVKISKVKTWFGKEKKQNKIIIDEEEDNMESDIVFSELEFGEKKDKEEDEIKGEEKEGNEREENEIVINNISNITPNVQAEKENKMLSFFSEEHREEEKGGKYFFHNSHDELESYEINDFREPSMNNFKNILMNKSNFRKWNDNLTASEGVKKGKFTRAETKKIIKAIIRYAFRLNLSYNELLNTILSRQKRKPNPIWTDIGAELPNRSIKSINDFCHRLFSPYNNKGLWSEEEIKTLVRMYRELGPRWKLIGDILRRHPENVRDKWKNISKKKSKSEIEEVDKPWNLSTVLKLVKYVNEDVYEKTNIANRVLKFGFRFNKMFKKGYLEGDRYLDTGEETLFIDNRIKLFSQRNFVYVSPNRS